MSRRSSGSTRSTRPRSGQRRSCRSSGSATLTLDRNPDNFFAETEQVAFCPSHVVPGIDFSNDPLLQGRLFSYLDTQLSRLGSANFHELPINRPDAPVSNNQRDGHMRNTVNKGRVAYQPNSLGGGCPFQAGGEAGGFVSHAERIDAHKIRGRSPSFGDHYSQAELFWRSQSDAEKEHIVSAFRFELAKVESKAIRRRMVDVLTNVDADLAKRVADGLGLAVDDVEAANKRLHADWHKYGVTSPPQGARASYEGVLAPELSMAETVKDTIKTRKIAILVADGVAGEDVDAFVAAIKAAGGTPEVIAPTLAAVSRTDGKTLVPDKALPTVMSVLYDAVFVPGGPLGSSALEGEGGAVHFLNEAFAHAKAIAATGAGVDLLLAASLVPVNDRTDAALAALPGVIAVRHGEDSACRSARASSSSVAASSAAPWPITWPTWAGRTSCCSSATADLGHDVARGGLMVTFGSTLRDVDRDAQVHPRPVRPARGGDGQVATGFKPVGFIEVAADADRLEEYRRVSAFNRHCGVDVHEISAREVGSCSRSPAPTTSSRAST
jgi:putative intracellular protease/amidase